MIAGEKPMLINYDLGFLERVEENLKIFSGKTKLPDPVSIKISVFVENSPK